MSGLKDRLKEARTEAGLSQGELARLAGLKNQSNIGNIEILGNSITKDGAWGALKTYYDKLKGNGILEQ